VFYVNLTVERLPFTFYGKVPINLSVRRVTQQSPSNAGEILERCVFCPTNVRGCLIYSRPAHAVVNRVAYEACRTPVIQSLSVCTENTGN
jgi:hypothetical protein